MDKYTSHHQQYQINDREYSCPFEVTASIMSGKWKMKIVKILYELETLRYSELKNTITEKITHKMLTQSLRELEEDGILLRKMYPQVPPRVEYSLTPAGMRLSQVIEAMNKFGSQYLVTTESTLELSAATA